MRNQPGRGDVFSEQGRRATTETRCLFSLEGSDVLKQQCKFLVLALLCIAANNKLAGAQCAAPAAWFPHATTPEPDFHQPGSNCEFHQWAWQEFLWLTQPDQNGRIRLLSLPTADMLFSP